MGIKGGNERGRDGEEFIHRLTISTKISCMYVVVL